VERTLLSAAFDFDLDFDSALDFDRDLGRLILTLPLTLIARPSTTVKERRFSAGVSARKSDRVERTLLSAAFDFDLDL